MLKGRTLIRKEFYSKQRQFVGETINLSSKVRWENNLVNINENGISFSMPDMFLGIYLKDQCN